MPEQQIAVSEDYLMLLLRCALFRDSWLGEGIDPAVLGQLSPGCQDVIRKWEASAP